MNLTDVFNAAKNGSLPEAKAVFVEFDRTLPKSSTLSESEIIERIGGANVILLDSVAEGNQKNGFVGVFVGSTAYLAEGMQLCDSFEEFVINVSGW